MPSLVDTAAFIVDIITLPILCSAVFPCRVKLRVFWIIYVLITPLYYYALTGFSWGSVWAKLPIIILWCLLIIAFYKGSLLHRACIAAVYLIVIAAMDNLLIGFALAVYKIPLEQLLYEMNLSAFFSVLTHILIFTICFLLSKILAHRKSQFKMPIWEWLIVLCVSGFSVIQLYFTMSSMETNGGNAIALFPIQAVVLLCMNVALLLLLDKLAASHRVETENITLLEQMRHNRQSLQTASAAYEAQRSLTHDFDNRLLIIAQLLQNGNSEQALDYIETVQKYVAVTQPFISTNNPIADAVLNQKYIAAQEQDIQMQFLINDLSDFPLGTDEIVTVVSNLLDNAIEACGHYDGKKSIKVKMMLEESAATISVANNSLPVEIDSDGSIKTGKQDKKSHGFGLKNVKKILQKAGFDFAVSYESGQFLFVAMKVI